MCELCNTDAYTLPLPIVMELQERAALRRQARREVPDVRRPDTLPWLRKLLFLGPLALTLGLILSAVLGWMTPRLRRHHVNMAIALPSFFALFAAFHRFIFDKLLPRSVTASWHAVMVLLMAFSIVDGSLLLQLL